jgi:hypothetical protein
MVPAVSDMLLISKTRTNINNMISCMTSNHVIAGRGSRRARGVNDDRARREEPESGAVPIIKNASDAPV